MGYSDNLIKEVLNELMETHNDFILVSRRLLISIVDIKSIANNFLDFLNENTTIRK
jgi:hypothetical protein